MNFPGREHDFKSRVTSGFFIIRNVFYVGKDGCSFVISIFRW